MAVKLKLSNPRSPIARTLGAGHPILRGLVIFFLGCLVVGALIFGYMYLKYQKIGSPLPYHPGAKKYFEEQGVKF